MNGEEWILRGTNVRTGALVLKIIMIMIDDDDDDDDHVF